MAYNSETDKIDKQSTDGLLGAVNSLAYRIHEVERHLHNSEKWFGAAVTPVGETHVADRMVGGVSPFSFLSGNNDFGSWVQIIGSNDTPITTGAVKFDAHRLIVTSTDSTSPFITQIVAGEFADIPTKLADEEYSETPYISATNLNDSGIEEIMVRRALVGEKVWARICCIGQNAKTLNLYFGLHEYEG